MQQQTTDVGILVDVERLKDANKELRELTETAGRSLANAFEGAVVKGRSLRQVVAGLAADMQRMAIRRTVEGSVDHLMGEFGSKLLGQVTNWVGQAAFGFAQGGVMTAGGPLPLNRYARGGIADSPQFALFGEGRRPEAFVPLPDGRSIPVRMEGAAPAAPVPAVNISMTVNTPDAAGFRRSEGQVGAALAASLQRHLRRNG